MSLLDKLLPVTAWEVFINGTSLGIYHARTAWGARRFHRLVARKLPVPKPANNFCPPERMPPAPMPQYSLADFYQADIEDGLNWNIANKIVPSIFAVIDLRYSKMVKGKLRYIETSLGCVPSARKDEVAEALQNSLNGSLSDAVKSFVVVAWIPYTNWRINKKVVDNDHIQEKYGLLDMDDIIKNAKNL